jgi:hypothetical protein
MSIVISELENLTKSIKEPGETDDEYHIRLVAMADSVIGDNEELWQSLSIATQSWMNKVIKAIMEESAIIPPLPDDKKKGKPKPVVSEQVEETPAPDPTTGANLTELTDTPPVVTPTPGPQTKPFTPEGKPSALKRTWMLMIEKPERTIADVISILESEGYVVNKSTVASKRSDVLYLLQLMKEMGRI